MVPDTAFHHMHVGCITHVYLYECFVNSDLQNSQMSARWSYMETSWCMLPHELGKKPVKSLFDKSSCRKLVRFAIICEGNEPDNLHCKKLRQWRSSFKSVTDRMLCNAAIIALHLL